MHPDPKLNEPGGSGADSDEAANIHLNFTGRFSDWLRCVQSDLGEKPAGPRIRWFGFVVAPILVGLILTIWIRLTGFDFTVQRFIYQAGGNSWAMGDHPFWNLLYRLGVLPATALSILGGVGYCLGWFWGALRPWRRVLCFLFLSMVIGPVVIVNASLKDFWGRPRPKEVVGLGGQYAFEPVLVVDPSSIGTSFPSGHATMGFYFLGGFFIFRRHRSKLARGFLIGGFAFGAIIGIGRMVQGGHFLSDVLWAGLISYYTGLGLHYALGLDQVLYQPTRPKAGAIPLWVKLGGAPLALALLVGVLLGTPYRTKWEAPTSSMALRKGPFDLRLVLSVGEVEIVPSGDFGITMEASGRGVPTSRIKRGFAIIEREECPELVYQENIRGWFSDLNSTVKVRVPWNQIRHLRLETADAGIRIVLAEVAGSPLIEVTHGRSDIRFFPAGQPLQIDEPEGRSRIERSGERPSPENAEGNGSYTLKIGGGFSGQIKLEEGDAVD